MVNDLRVIILLVKYPQPGQVKTRLARTLGNEAAVSIYRQLVVRLIRMLRRVSVEELRVCYDPAVKHKEIEDWLRPIWQDAGKELVSDKKCGTEATLIFRPQCEGDLGARLKLAFSQVLQENEQAGTSELQVLAIGSDCIEIDEQTFEMTWKALETKDVVFGPTPDGGYYLVGMKTFYPDLFENIPWSTEKTLEASLQRVRELNLKADMLDEKHDIDTEEDWLRAARIYSLMIPSESGDEEVEEK